MSCCRRKPIRRYRPFMTVRTGEPVLDPRAEEEQGSACSEGKNLTLGVVRDTLVVVREGSKYEFRAYLRSQGCSFDWSDSLFAKWNSLGANEKKAVAAQLGQTFTAAQLESVL